MAKKSEDFSMKDAARLAKSETGQQLYSVLQKKDGDLFRQAMDQAAAGNYEEVKKSMSALLKDPEVRELLSRLGGERNG